MKDGHVTNKIEISGIATIEFGHPQSNSLPGAILEKLRKTITDVGAQNDVKVIILKSAGDKAFCGGASFDELAAISDEKTGLQFFSGFANVINAIRKCPKLVLGRVQGKAVGGGVGIASAVDYCFATKHSAVKLSELAVGIGPFVVGPAVERKVGLSAFSHMTINATEFLSADWAREKGLYMEVHETAADMDSAILTLAEKLAGSNPEATAKLKRVFWEGTENWDNLLKVRAAISGQLVLSEFTKNAIASFKKK